MHASAYGSIRQHLSVARHYSKGDARVLKLDILAPIKLDILVLINELLINENQSSSWLYTILSILRQHTSVSIRHLATAYVAIRHLASAYVISRQHTSSRVSIRQHTSSRVSIRHLASAYVGIRQIPAIVVAREYVERLPGKDGKLIAFCGRVVIQRLC